jgi:hypothetical protein
MLQGSVASEYVVCHETLGAAVERLQGGPPIVHRLTLPLGPGRWFVSATMVAGLANVSATMRLEGGGGEVRALGGQHNGAMSPHFGPATVMAYFDDVVVTKAEPAHLVVQFESIAPTAIAVVGHRIVSLTAWKRAAPVSAAAPASKPPPAPKPVAAAKADLKPAPKPAAKPPAAAPAPPAKAAAKPAVKAVAATREAVKAKPAPSAAKPAAKRSAKGE